MSDAKQEWLARNPTVILGASTRRQVMEQSRLRLSCIMLVFGLSFMAIALRVVDLSLPADGSAVHLLAQQTATPAGLNLMTLMKGSKQDLEKILEKNSLEGGREGIVQPRVEITDRNGLVLATSLKTASLYADAREIKHPEKAARAIMGVLEGFDPQKLTARLASGKSFVWLRRNLAPKEQQAVNNLGIPGLYFQNEYVRVYPHANLMAHALGFVGVDNNGLAGVERFFDERLRNTENPEPLALALDIRIQHLMHAELSKAVANFNAIGAIGVVADVTSGEIVSMVSLPDFDPNHPTRTPPEALFNRVALGTYEMGSSFKTFTLAQALETGAVSIQDGYDATNPIRVASFTISDFHPKSRWLSVPEIFAYSSNIGTVKMAMDVGVEPQKKFFDQLGLLKPVSIELRERGLPQYPSRWEKISMMTISYGHGISVTPLHLVQGYLGLLNEGRQHPLTLQRQHATTEAKAKQIISRETSHKVRRLLRSVVQYGTGKNAEAPGYRVGGKTGTAEKISGRGYSDKARIASFMGAFPMDDPRYVVLVMLDEPKGNKSTYGYATGGWVAAPVASRVIAQMGPLLGIQPVMEVVPDTMDAMWDSFEQRERERQRRIHAASY